MTKNLNMGWNFEDSYTHLPERFFTKTKPTFVDDPRIVVLNESLAKTLGLNIDLLYSREAISILVGNNLADGSQPIAQAYAGHQFGYFTMLGDGRAILLGEQINPKGERYDIQLKGSGITPYSRGGDGRAALSPMLREYIISEAMYGLGIPTTRSLAVIATGEQIVRESLLTGAILTRVASSHIRVGTFQYAKKWAGKENLQLLADYTINRHFLDYISYDTRYLYLLKEVIKRQARLIAKWMSVGFIHGVMNTDNMLICGETIDYGPCAFMDTYHPNTVFSSIDKFGRYAYVNQPSIGAWNLARFADTLVPLLDNDEDIAVAIAKEAVSAYGKLYKEYWMEAMRCKLGLIKEESEDEEIILELLDLMKENKADYTNTFRALTIGDYSGIIFSHKPEFKQWEQLWMNRRLKEDKSPEKILNLMKSSNPNVIPRNHRVEEALNSSETGDYSLINKLLKVLSNPYEYSKEQDEYCKLPPESWKNYRTFCGT